MNVCDGAAVGALEGAAVTAAVGDAVGDSLGELEGEAVGDALGEAVGSAVMNACAPIVQQCPQGQPSVELAHAITPLSASLPSRQHAPSEPQKSHSPDAPHCAQQPKPSFVTLNVCDGAAVGALVGTTESAAHVHLKTAGHERVSGTRS